MRRLTSLRIPGVGTHFLLLSRVLRVYRFHGGLYGGRVVFSPDIKVLEGAKRVE